MNANVLAESCGFLILFFTPIDDPQLNPDLGERITDVFLDQTRVNVCEHMRRHLYRVFTYIYSLLAEKDICDH